MYATKEKKREMTPGLRVLGVRRSVLLKEGNLRRTRGERWGGTGRWVSGVQLGGKCDASLKAL